MKNTSIANKRNWRRKRSTRNVSSMGKTAAPVVLKMLINCIEICQTTDVS